MAAIRDGDEGAHEANDDFFPSGQWRGCYDQYGSRHHVCEFSLTFVRGTITGAGVDDIGAYDIVGHANGRARRMAFTKQYIRGSRNSQGRRNGAENLGHHVEYRGECAGRSLGQGVKGTWYVETAKYRGQGRFHLWPAMPAWNQLADGPVETFEVTDDNVCVVCYDRHIDIVLDPCGHAAVCAVCYSRLPRTVPVGMTERCQRCPICNIRIDGVVAARRPPEAGTAGGDDGQRERSRSRGRR